MKVLMISKDDTFLGARISDSLIRHQIYAELLNRYEPGSKINVIFPAGKSSPGIEGVLTLIPVSKLGYFIKALIKSFAIVRKEDVDLIVTQSPFDDGLTGLILSRIFKKRLIIQVHGDLLAYRSNPLEYLLGPFASVLYSIRLFWCYFLAKSSSKIRVVSSAIKSDLIKTFDLPADKIAVLPVGVTYKPLEASRQERQRLKEELIPKASGKKVVLFVGRLTREKNLPMLVRTALKVVSRLKDVCFVVVGDGPERDKLKRDIKRNYLDDHLILAGEINYKKLPCFYCASDVLVLTSRSEAFGRVLIEAYLQELPCVATKTSGPQDIITDNETGYLVDIDDDSAMAERITQLLEDPQLSAKMGREGAKCVKDKFTFLKLADEYVKMMIQVARS